MLHNKKSHPKAALILTCRRKVLFVQLWISNFGQRQFLVNWWIRPGSNRPPPRCERGALPDELRTHRGINNNYFFIKKQLNIVGRDIN